MSLIKFYQPLIIKQSLWRFKMDKEGIMIYLCMKGQNEWLEEVKAYFQKSSYVLKVIEIDDWQNELSLTNQKGEILLEKIKQIQLKNKYLKCYISGYSLNVILAVIL